jgi:hypothetical protein
VYEDLAEDLGQAFQSHIHRRRRQEQKLTGFLVNAKITNRELRNVIRVYFPIPSRQGCMQLDGDIQAHYGLEGTSIIFKDPPDFQM